MTALLQSMLLVLLSISLAPREAPGAENVAAVASDVKPADKAAAEKEKKKQEADKAKRAAPYKGVFYDNDFSYLEGSTERRKYYEWLKWLKPTDDVRFDFGGEYRYRFHSEVNRYALEIGSPTNPQSEDFSLHRLRVYADAHFKDWLRGYFEFLDASIVNEELPPFVIDQDRNDFQNYFVDLRVWRSEGAQSWLRVGRQELLYGEQRVISPLDWANTRRTFSDAVKFFRRGDCWDVDAFWGRPNILDDEEFNAGDQSQWFGGVYSTYKGYETMKISPYFLILREEDVIPGPAFGTGHRIGSGNADTRVYTLGCEIKGELENWLWDFEGATQFGTYGVQTVLAGMCAVGVGRRFATTTWQPTLWAWYDLGTGDPDPFDNQIGTYNHLFPLGHKYFGFLDLTARSNVHDFNAQLFLKPTKKLTLLAWMHLMFLASSRDAMYNVFGVASRQDVLGVSGNVMGQEIDLLATYAVNPSTELQLGWSYFWSGNFVKNTGGNSFAEFLYAQFQVRF